MGGMRTSVVSDAVRVLVSVLPLVLVAACASAPHSQASLQVSQTAADQAAGQAAKMVGRPYRFGGSSPSAGFDCSGLVQYSYRHAGITLPHSTDKQRSASRLVKVADLRRGDLLFFHQEGKKHGHVGIYLGAGKFVHAPSSGKTVRSDRLDSPYWKKHLTEARRLTV
jgi:murein DD-endopeptidase